MTNPDIGSRVPAAKSAQPNNRAAKLTASNRPVLASLVSLVVALTVLAMALLLVESRVSGLLSAAAPIVVHVVFCRLAGIRRSTPSVSLLFGSSYLVFFGSGYLLLISNQQELGFRPGFISLPDANGALALTSLITVFLCAGSLATIRSAIHYAVVDTGTRAPSQAFAVTTSILFLLALAGAAGTVAEYGSITATIDAFTVHDRNNTLGLAGSSAFRTWSVFSLPAIIALEVCIVSARTRTTKAVSLLALSILLAAGLLVFTSRLIIILALIAYVAVLFKGSGRTIPGSLAASSAAIFVVASFILVSQRPGGLDLQRVTLLQRLLQILNYGIVDVGLSASASRDSLAELFRSPARILTLLESALPGLGPDQESISRARVDVIVVRTIGSVAQGDDSALPPSTPFYILIGFGAVAGCLFAALLGLAAGRVFSLLQRPTGLIWTFFCGFYFAFLFNTFKGGDLALDIASEARRSAYVVAIYVASDLCLKVRGPSAEIAASRDVGESR